MLDEGEIEDCVAIIGRKIRELMRLLGIRGQLSRHVEVGESYVGGKSKGDKRGRGAEHHVSALEGV